MGKFFNKAIFYDQWSKLWSFIIVIVFIIAMKPITFIDIAENIKGTETLNNFGINLDVGEYFILIVLLITMVAISTGFDKQKNLSFLNSKNVTRKQILGSQLIATFTVSMIAVIISTLVRVVVYFLFKEVFNEYLNIYIIDIVLYFFIVSTVIINVLIITWFYQLLFGKTIIAVLFIPATLMYLFIGPVALWRATYHFRFLGKLVDEMVMFFYGLYEMATQGYIRGEDLMGAGSFLRKDSVMWMIIVLGITAVLLCVVFLLNQCYEVQNLNNIFIFNKVRIVTNVFITIMCISLISLILYISYASLHEKATGEILRVAIQNGDLAAESGNRYEDTVRFICNIISLAVSPFIYMLLNKITNAIDGVESKKVKKDKA